MVGEKVIKSRDEATMNNEDIPLAVLAIKKLYWPVGRSVSESVTV